MTANNPRNEGKLRALHHFEEFRASREPRIYSLQMKPSEQPETDQAVKNEEDRHYQI
jgi:hypothetical protein